MPPSPSEVELVCDACGRSFVVTLRRGRRPKRCSEQCRLEAGRRRSELYRLRPDYRPTKQPIRERTSTPIDYRPCVVCGSTFVLRLVVGRTLVAVCGRRCRNRRGKAQADPAKVKADRRRYVEARRAREPGWPYNTGSNQAASRRRWARKSGAVGELERIVPLEVYERDGWRCAICRRKVNRRKAWPHPLSPSLDHIIPLSIGGPHTMANVRLAHLRCNSEKRTGTGPAGDQLRLLG